MRITDQLGMNSTRIALSPDMQERLAAGHNGQLERVGNWDVTTLAGAGALRSTANDMLTFLAANLGYTQSPLSPAITAMLSTRPLTARESMIGWQTVTLDVVRDGHDIVWRNGGTVGFRAFIAFDPRPAPGSPYSPMRSVFPGRCPESTI